MLFYKILFQLALWAYSLLHNYEHQLIDAVINSDEQRVLELLAIGANVNASPSFFGHTALGFAVALDQCEIAKHLLAHNANIDIQDERGTSVLMQAAYNGYVDMIKLLLEKGADANLQDEYNRTAFDLARLGNRPESMALLSEHSAMLKELDLEVAQPGASKYPDGNAVIANVIKYYYKPALKLLLQSGLTIANSEKCQILLQAITRNDIATVRELFTTGYLLEDAILPKHMGKKMHECIHRHAILIRTLFALRYAGPTGSSHNVLFGMPKELIVELIRAVACESLAD